MRGDVEEDGSTWCGGKGMGRQMTLGARAPRNEWEHFRNTSRSGSILLHCNQQTHLWNIWNVLLK